MEERCPECGTDKEMGVRAGISGQGKAKRYWCGTIYWPEKKMVTARGVVCKEIAKLRAELAAEKQEHGLTKLAYENEKRLRESCEMALSEEQQRREGFQNAEREVSDAYLRLRNILDAFDTPYGPSAREVWEHTEAKAKQVFSELAAERKAKEDAEDYCNRVADSARVWVERCQDAEAQVDVLLGPIKEIAVKFFRWWYNQPGSNTDQGFDRWWELYGQEYNANLPRLHQEVAAVLEAADKLERLLLDTSWVRYHNAHGYWWTEPKEEAKNLLDEFTEAVREWRERNDLP